MPLAENLADASNLIKPQVVHRTVSMFFCEADVVGALVYKGM